MKVLCTKSDLIAYLSSFVEVKKEFGIELRRFVVKILIVIFRSAILLWKLNSYLPSELGNILLALKNIHIFENKYEFIKCVFALKLTIKQLFSCALYKIATLILEQIGL